MNEGIDSCRVLERKAAGEYHATKQITHRPSLTRADGLHARDKVHLMISQTGRHNKIGGMNHVLV